MYSVAHGRTCPAPIAAPTPELDAVADPVAITMAPTAHAAAIHFFMLIPPKKKIDMTGCRHPEALPPIP
jgi:hypothetical protein